MEYLKETMLKVTPHPDYPPEAGRYLRGNDASPVAVAIILCTDADKIPVEIEALVRARIENGIINQSDTEIGLYC